MEEKDHKLEVRLYTADKRPSAGHNGTEVENRKDRFKHKLCKVSTVHQSLLQLFHPEMESHWEAYGGRSDLLA